MSRLKQLLSSSLGRLFGPSPRNLVWTPARIGPKYEWFSPAHIRILEGELAGQEFELVTEVKDDAASVFMYYYGQRIGQTYVERDPPGRGVVFWDIGVKDEFRRKGLASIMTVHIFRELLRRQDKATFKIRMVRLLKPGDKDVELQNMGMGVIANRLGFTPELNIERILAPGNITSIDVIPARPGLPPAFRFDVRTFPLVLIAFVLDQDTRKPVDDFRTYVELSKDEQVIHDWVRRGLIVISNGNYWLRRSGIGLFLNHVATSPEEARAFAAKVVGL
ncbi:MAG: hypothetical protein ABIK86_00925 [candidate division WOR-3 bacterium]